MYDLAIIGAGPAGSAAAVYAARKKLRTVLITESFGGQSAVSPAIENWIGTVSISGEELAKNLEKHVRAYAGTTVDIRANERVAAVEGAPGCFHITNQSGAVVEAKTVLVATGGERRKLAVPGADALEHKGVTYCASCDGPLFSGAHVAVIGGGNAGFETAAQLLAYAQSVTLLHHSPSFSADPVTVERVLAHPAMQALTNAKTTAILGEKFVTGLKYTTKTGLEQELAVTGVFVEIGMLPSTSFIAELVDTDQFKRIIVDPKNQRASCLGVWAAGDCTNALFHQNNIAAGDGVKALEDIYLFLKA